MQCHDAARKALPVHARETGCADHFRERIRFRKFADRFHKVAIRFSVAGYGAAQRRYHIEGKQVVKPIEPRHVHGGEFKAQESSAGLEYTKSLLKRRIDSRHVANAKSDGVAIESAV